MLFPLLVALMAAIAIGAVAWPILQNARGSVPALQDELAELAAQRDAALKAVKDLEFDFQVGKVTAEDYPIYDRRLKEQASSAIQAYDAALAAARPTQRPAKAQDASIEAEIAALRGVHLPDTRPRRPRKTAPSVDDSLEAEIAALRRPQAAAAPAAAPRFCSQCGQPLRPGDRFCSACGAAVAVPAA